MTEEATTTEKPPVRVLTSQLTMDQRGWAKLRHPEHYRTNGARWTIDKHKPSVPTPVPMDNKPRKRRVRYS